MTTSRYVQVFIFILFVGVISFATISLNSNVKRLTLHTIHTFLGKFDKKNTSVELQENYELISLDDENDDDEDDEEDDEYDESLFSNRSDITYAFTTQATLVEYEFSQADLHRQFAFSSDSPVDVLVFLHIQKTSGTTFGKNLVWYLDVHNPCKCNRTSTDKHKNVKLRCPCFTSDGKKQWLYSRYSTGWICGLHADFTEWTECLASGKGDEVEDLHRFRRYLMFTILREPLERYISEWLHVGRGATWSDAKLRCNHKQPTASELPECYEGDDWTGVTLPDFLSCPYNLAHNRQTRMLANLSLVDCYKKITSNDPIVKQVLLQSAKENLKNMAFFGLKSYPKETQYLFEHTFGVKFKQDITYVKPSTVHTTKDYLKLLNPPTLKSIRQQNDLDIELYEFAHQLFMKRYEYAKSMSQREFT